MLMMMSDPLNGAYENLTMQFFFRCFCHTTGPQTYEKHEICLKIIVQLAHFLYCCFFVRIHNVCCNSWNIRQRRRQRWQQQQKTKWQRCMWNVCIQSRSVWSWEPLHEYNSHFSFSYYTNFLAWLEIMNIKRIVHYQWWVKEFYEIQIFLLMRPVTWAFFLLGSSTLLYDQFYPKYKFHKIREEFYFSTVNIWNDEMKIICVVCLE